MTYVWPVLIVATLNLALGFAMPWLLAHVFAVDILPRNTAQTTAPADGNSQGLSVSAPETPAKNAARKSAELERNDSTGEHGPPSHTA